MVAEPGSKGRTAGRAQDAQGGITEGREDGGAGSSMYQARVLPQVHILAAMALILDQPMPSFQSQQTLG